MALLIVGLLLFTLVHLMPAAFGNVRESLVTRLGENAYRGLFSLLVIASLVLIVLGWRSAVPTSIYAPPLIGGPIVAALMLAALVLFVAARSGSNIKRYVRHPQMLAVILWSAAHLLYLPASPHPLGRQLTADSLGMCAHPRHVTNAQDYH